MYEEWLSSLGLFNSEQRNWGEALWWPPAPHEGSGGTVLRSALCDSSRVWGNGTRKILPQRAQNSQPNEQTQPQAAGAQEVLGHHSQTYGLGGAVWSQGLHSVILVSPFQCKIFYDSMKQGRKWERYWRVWKRPQAWTWGMEEKNKWLNASLEESQWRLHCTKYHSQQGGTLPGYSWTCIWADLNSICTLPGAKDILFLQAVQQGWISFVFHRHLSWISARTQRPNVCKPAISRILFPSLSLIAVLTCQIPQYCFSMTFAVNQRLQGKLDCSLCSAAAVGAANCIRQSAAEGLTQKPQLKCEICLPLTS